MTSSRRLAFAAIVSIVGVACATGTLPETGGGSGVGDGDSGAAGDAESPLQNYGDGGAPGDGATFVPKDSGPKTPIDSGTTTPIDSGTTTPPPDLCSGETSSHSVPSTGGDKDYDIWCDYDSFYGDPLPCTSNSDCTGNYTASYEPECCYKPVAGGYCQGDFKGKYQCVPK